MDYALMLRTFIVFLAGGVCLVSSQKVFGTGAAALDFFMFIVSLCVGIGYVIGISNSYQYKDDKETDSE